MKLFVISLLAILVIFGAASAYRLAHRKGFFPRSLPLDAMRRVEENDECNASSKCLAVYLAPWCPECHKQFGVIRSAYKELHMGRDIGMMVVVGADEPVRLDEMISELSIPAAKDPDKSFKRAAGIRGVPAWLLIEKNGSISRRFKSISEIPEETIQKLAEKIPEARG